jgi:uncharacterized membrane protein
MTDWRQNITLWRWMSLTGLFGTMAFLLAWIIFLAPPTQLPRSIALAIALIPLLLPMRGILHGKPYTHAWASFLTMPYFAFGVDAAVHRSSDNWLGLVLTALSLLMFCGFIFYAKFAARAAKSTDEVNPAPDNDAQTGS